MGWIQFCEQKIFFSNKIYFQAPPNEDNSMGPPTATEYLVTQNQSK